MHPARGHRGAGVVSELFGPKPTQLELETDATEAQLSLWHRSGWMAESPRVELKALVRPLRYSDAPEVPVLEAMNLMMHSRLLAEDMAPRMVDLVAAGVSYSVDFSSAGVSLSFGGFGPALPRLIAAVLQEV